MLILGGLGKDKEGETRQTFSFFLLYHQTNRATSFLSPRDSSIRLQRQEFKLNDLFDLNKSESDPVTGIKNNCNNYTEIANLLADDLFTYVGHKEASVSN